MIYWMFIIGFICGGIVTKAFEYAYRDANKLSEEKCNCSNNKEESCNCCDKEDNDACNGYGR